jgi:hypothetical protein
MYPKHEVPHGFGVEDVFDALKIVTDIVWVAIVGVLVYAKTNVYPKK